MGCESGFERHRYTTYGRDRKQTDRCVRCGKIRLVRVELEGRFAVAVREGKGLVLSREDVKVLAERIGALRVGQGDGVYQRTTGVEEGRGSEGAVGGGSGEPEEGHGQGQGDDLGEAGSIWFSRLPKPPKLNGGG